MNAGMRSVMVCMFMIAFVPFLAEAEKSHKDITADDYPGESAVVLFNKRVHTFEPYIELIKTYHYGIYNNTIFEEKQKIKILTEEGIDKFGDFVSRIYNEENHKYEAEVTVISPKGKKKKFKHKDMERIQIGKRYYQYRFAYPGLEVGSMIEIEQKIKSDVVLLSGKWNFASDVPVLHSEFAFKLPKDAEVKFYMTPEEKLARIKPEKDGKLHVYTIAKDNIPPYRYEPFMSLEHIGNPTLYYYVRRLPNYVMEDFLDIERGMLEGEPYRMFWRTIGEAYADYFNPSSWKDKENADQYREEMFRFVDSIDKFMLRGKELRLRKMIEMFHEQFQPIKDKFLYATKNPEECFSLREGGPFELAYVLKAFLNLMDISSEVVLVRDLTDGLLDKRTPTYNAFTHAILHVRCNGEEFWIDPFNHHCALGQLPWECQGVEGLWLSMTGKYVFRNITMDPPDENCIRNVCVGCLNDDGDLSGKLTMTVSGQYLINLRQGIDIAAEGALEEELETLLEDILPETLEYDSLQVIEDGSDELVISLKYSNLSFAETTGDFMNVDFSKWFRRSLASLFEDDARTYDIHFPFMRSDHTTVEITIPEGMQIKELPGTLKVGNEWLGYERDVKSKENTITFTRKLSVKVPTIAADKYGAVKETISEIHKLDKETMVLERKQG